ncbi:MAG: hypothetical protein H3C54_02660 [Taibaiella sp.]|nr:hypothetical protein [Taibaiella sp.]
MKRILWAPVLLTVLSTGCRNKANTNVTPGGSNNSISETVASGKWSVSYFYDKDKEETSDYSGYSFEFKTDKTLSATRSGTTTTGTWNETTDDGLPRLVIMLNTTDDKLTELNDDWVIESKTDTQIKLKDDNPDRNEQLHFNKQ